MDQINLNQNKFENIFAGNEHHRGITSNGKYPHYLEKNKPFKIRIMKI